MRGWIEQLVRLALSLPSPPAMLFLSYSRGIAAEQTQRELHGEIVARYFYEAQLQVLEPVAAVYGLVLVSYRDAIWPSFERPPNASSHLFDTFRVHANHPRSHTHQLMADCLAFAWEALAW